MTFIPQKVQKIEKIARKALENSSNILQQIENGEIGGGGGTDIPSGAPTLVTRTVTINAGTNQDGKSPIIETIKTNLENKFSVLLTATVQISVPSDYVLNDGAVSYVGLRNTRIVPLDTQSYGITEQVTYDSDTVNLSATLQVLPGQTKFQKFVLLNLDNGRIVSGHTSSLLYTDIVDVVVTNLGTVGASGNEVTIRVDAQFMEIDLLPQAI